MAFLPGDFLGRLARRRVLDAWSGPVPELDAACDRDCHPQHRRFSVAGAALKRDGFWMNHGRALAYCLRMISAQALTRLSRGKTATHFSGSCFRAPRR